MFTIYSADVTGNPGNCSYPHKHIILDEDSLKAAVCHDYVCAEYKKQLSQRATTSSAVTVFQLTVIMIIPRIRKTGSLRKMVLAGPFRV